MTRKSSPKYSTFTAVSTLPRSAAVTSSKIQAHKSPTPAQIKYFRPALWKVSPVLFYILQSSAHRIAQFYVSICRIACTIAIKSCSFNSAIPCSSSPRTISTSPGFMSKIFLAFAGITICPFHRPSPFQTHAFPSAETAGVSPRPHN